MQQKRSQRPNIPLGKRKSILTNKSSKNWIKTRSWRLSSKNVLKKGWRLKEELLRSVKSTNSKRDRRKKREGHNNSSKPKKSRLVPLSFMRKRRNSSVKNLRSRRLLARWIMRLTELQRISSTQRDKNQWLKRGEKISYWERHNWRKKKLDWELSRRKKIED